MTIGWGLKDQDIREGVYLRFVLALRNFATFKVKSKTKATVDVQVGRLYTLTSYFLIGCRDCYILSAWASALLVQT